MHDLPLLGYPSRESQTQGLPLATRGPYVTFYLSHEHDSPRNHIGCFLFPVTVKPATVTRDEGDNSGGELAQAVR